VHIRALKNKKLNVFDYYILRHQVNRYEDNKYVKAFRHPMQIWKPTYDTRINPGKVIMPAIFFYGPELEEGGKKKR
jgi:hypothetical protein